MVFIIFAPPFFAQSTLIGRRNTDFFAAAIFDNHGKIRNADIVLPRFLSCFIIHPPKKGKRPASLPARPEFLPAPFRKTQFKLNMVLFKHINYIIRNPSPDFLHNDDNYPVYFLIRPRFNTSGFNPEARLSQGPP
jgi:hypothetical protein